MFEMTVRRQLTQRRSPRQIREDVEYLANLPRKVGFALESIEVDEPVPQGLLWNYRAIIRYVPKKDQKPDRLEKDNHIIITRVSRACEHKRWGRALWQVEGENSTNGPREPANLPAQITKEEAREKDGGLGPINGLAKPADRSAQPAEEEMREEACESTKVSPLSEVRRSTFRLDIPSDDTIRRAAVKLDMISDPTRLKTVLILAIEERNVTELCVDLGSQSQPAVSHHLSILRHERLVETRRDGKHNFYRLTNDGRELAKVVEQLWIDSK